MLIVPNPESALNEEAGKMLLERYEDYAKHAKLITSIHATKKVSVEDKTEAESENIDLPKSGIKEKEIIKKTDKKKSLKRL